MVLIRAVFFYACLGAAFSLSPVTAEARDVPWSPDIVTASLDLRLFSADGERPWTKGGFGKLRHGHEKGAELAEALVVLTPRLSDNVTLTVTTQLVPGAENPLGVTEAFVRWKPVPTSPTRYTFRLGRLFLPVSLENDGAGWTATRTLTPSAINTWIGEEGLVEGAEASVSRPIGAQRLGVTGGIFRRADTMGTVLALRGWTLHDMASTTDAALRLPDGHGTGYTTLFVRQAPYSKPGAEVDGRYGGYVRLDWQPPLPVAFNLEYVNNPGNPEIVTKGQYGWSTDFINAGLHAQLGSAEVLAQAMAGRTKMGAVMSDGHHPADVKFDTGYLLVSHPVAAGRLTGRLDYFHVGDRSLRPIDDNTELGYAGTIAFKQALSGYCDLSAEAVRTISRRDARPTQALLPRQTQTQFQLSLKFHG